MFFILSKILFFLLIPFWWMVILLLLRAVIRNLKWKKILGVMTIVIGILFTNPYLHRLANLAWQPTPVDLPTDKTYDAGILLGGMAGYDKYDRGYFGGSADRFIQSANLYHQGIIKKIIVSGGTGTIRQKEPAEAIYLRSQLIANGVKPEDIIMESRSRNTYENAVYSKLLTDSLQLQPPFILITSAQHMKRSISVFKKADFKTIPFPCDYKSIPIRETFENTLVPEISLLNDWSFLIKEIVGLYVYRFTGKA
ncbi:MAG TPA: YdcF family protein [Sediminibacterium sp.]